MSLHDRTWRYIPAATHATSEAFRDRQRARLCAAREARRNLALTNGEPAPPRQSDPRQQQARPVVSTED